MTGFVKGKISDWNIFFYYPESQTPREMDRADMDAVKADFVRAVGLAEEAGFDMLEVHLAHGYLLGGFISPMTNKRTDEYGGDIEGRMRFPLEIFAAVRAAWPERRPMSARVSAIDWHADGQSIEDSIVFARALKERGVDVIDVSTGHSDTSEKPDYDRCYQVPFSERIRLATGVPTMTVGGISRHGEINAILASGEADLVVLARPHVAVLFLHVAPGVVSVVRVEVGKALAEGSFDPREPPTQSLDLRIASRDEGLFPGARQGVVPTLRFGLARFFQCGGEALEDSRASCRLDIQLACERPPARLARDR